MKYLYWEVLLSEYIIFLFSLFAHTCSKLKNFNGFWIFNYFFLNVCGTEYAINHCDWQFWHFTEVNL